MKKSVSVCYALLAALFYSVSTPCSKWFLSEVPPTLMAAFLYLGAGLGVGILYAFHFKKEKKEERLTGKDLPYTLGMIALDIAAPIFLMYGISLGSAENASLLGNFEIVSTALLALLFFRETVTGRLWIAIAFITASGILLSREGTEGASLSLGSLFVLAATLCWGLENNCTRRISEKSTYEIVTLKGLGSGTGALLVALLCGETFPAFPYIPAAMLLGFIAYGLSIFTYIRAQRELGAAETSAFYAVAPFIGAFLAFLFFDDPLTPLFFVALAFMAIGTAFAVWDTVRKEATAKSSLKEEIK